MNRKDEKEKRLQFACVAGDRQRILRQCVWKHGHDRGRVWEGRHWQAQPLALAAQTLHTTFFNEALTLDMVHLKLTHCI